MSELISDYAPEPAVVSQRRRMPGWAIALAVACVAVATAIVSVTLVTGYQARYHHDIYQRCLATNAANVQFVGVLNKLRKTDTDARVAIKALPGSPVKTIFVNYLDGQVAAYDDLLVHANVPPTKCDKLK